MHVALGQTPDIYSNPSYRPWNEGKVFDKSNFANIFFGSMHRETWSKSVMLPELSLGSNKDFQVQTTESDSLHVIDGTGQLYLVKLLAPDQQGYPNAAIFPYGSYLANQFAEIANVATATNGWVIIPDDASLGKYRGRYANNAAILEPVAVTEQHSTADMLNVLDNERSAQVNARLYLRARLLAIWLGDWEQTSQHMLWQADGSDAFVPYVKEWRSPFFAYDGLLPHAFNRKWLRCEWQNFYRSLRDLRGLVHTSFQLDKRLLTSLREDDWLQEVRDIRTALQNEEIERIVGKLPESVSAKVKESIIERLQFRKYGLEDAALAYYQLINEQVEIHGTNEADQIIVQRLAGGELAVRRFNPETGSVMLNKEVYPAETREVIVYGKDGDDDLTVTGVSSNKTKVRVVGGEGHDKIQDLIGGGDLIKHTVIYDTEFGNTIDPGRKARVDYSLNHFIARYDPDGNQRDKLIPNLLVGYNRDDKLYLGGSATFIHYGYGRVPHAALNRVYLVGSFDRSIVEFGYYGDFTKIFGPFGFRADLRFQLPHLTTYHGEGSNTDRAADESFNNVTLSNIELFGGFTGRFKHGEFYAGPTYRWTEVEETEGQVMAEDPPPEGEDIFNGNFYTGARLGLRINTLDDMQFPENGIDWHSSVNYVYQLDGPNRRFTDFHSRITGYYTFSAGIPFTLVGRAGAGVNTGDYAFYQSQTLGAGTGYNRGGSIRGYVRDRFRGFGNILPEY